MKKLLATLDHAPMFWLAVALGILVFSLNRTLPAGTWQAPVTEQQLLDRAFIESIRTGSGEYQVNPNTPQTFGPHVLPQYLRSTVALITGDAERAGIWLSIAGVIGMLTGLYLLAIRIYPLRGFAVGSVCAAGALSSIHLAIFPDPSVALGMGFVVWGMAQFLTAITDSQPTGVFFSGILFGLAGYIRIELSLVWLFLAIYLIALHFLHAKKRQNQTSALSMALGGLFSLLIVLWPMVHRNVGLAGTPLLPGYDAEWILGARVMPGEAASIRFLPRFLSAIYATTFGPNGPGVFAGLLWPIGMGLCLFIGRHKRIPYFWFPVLIANLAGMTLLGAMTGQESMQQTLQILTPLLIPFALIPIVFFLEKLFVRVEMGTDQIRMAWIGAIVLFLMLVQLPNFFRGAQRDTTPIPADQWVDVYAGLPADLRNAPVLSDRPGALVSAGKQNVIGTKGQTDWSILVAATASGGLDPDRLVRYLQARKIEVIHLSDPQDPLVERLRLVDGAPTFEQVNPIPAPYRLFRIFWP